MFFMLGIWMVKFENMVKKKKACKIVPFFYLLKSQIGAIIFSQGCPHSQTYSISRPYWVIRDGITRNSIYSFIFHCSLAFILHTSVRRISTPSSAHYPATVSPLCLLPGRSDRTSGLHWCCCGLTWSCLNQTVLLPVTQSVGCDNVLTDCCANPVCLALALFAAFCVC